MKTKLLLSLFLSFYFYLLSSQIPQGFNYQAIARDASGNAITNHILPVRITVQSDSLGGTTFWIEEHPSVTTNSLGLFTLVLGKGIRKSGSTVSTFNNIDWSVTPKFIKTEIDYSGWKEMGSSRLWSVPYSMVADSTKALLKGSKLSVISENDGTTDALFEVKRKDGQTVFAVYPNAVNIYVPRTSKGTKGGFAIGGFETVKSDPQDYFRVTPDSVRIYIDQTPNLLKGATKGGFAIGGFDQVKGGVQDLLTVSNDSVRIYIDKTPIISKGATKGGFAIGGFDQVKGGTQDLLTVSNDSIRMYINDVPGKGATKGGFAIGGFEQGKGPAKNFMNVATDNNGIVNPAQNRIMWYPMLDKNAFLVGRVLIEHPDSVGVNSVSTGYESRAKGNYSQAFGYQSVARGLYSTAIGNQAIAHRDNSFAFGENAYAGNNYTYAFGKGAKATGLSSFALGEGVQATNYNSYALGHWSQATGYNSYAFGDGTLASGTNSIAFGRLSQATDSSSFASGEHAQATKKNAFALGKESVATGISSYALGEYAVASNQNAFALGKSANASGLNSFAFGENAQASNSNSVAMGKGAIASGVGSYAFGSYGHEYNWTPNFESNTMASGDNSFAAGMGAVATTDKSISIGFCTQATGAVSIAMGFGSIAGDQHSSIAMGEYAKSTGYASVSMGYWTIATGIGSVALGKATLALNDACFATGSFNLGLSNSILELGNGTSEGAGRSNALTILNNGNMGLLTSAPKEVLQVGQESSGATARKAIKISSGGYSPPAHFQGNCPGDKLILYDADGLDARIGIGTSADMWFKASGSDPEVGRFIWYNGYAPKESMRLDGSGNLGIGTSNPLARLDVNGTEGSPLEAAIQNTRVNYPQFILKATGGAANAKIWRITSRSDGTAQIQTLDDSYSNESTIIGMLHNGNVGIGTLSPSKKLEVNGDALFNGNTVSSGYLRVVGYPAPILTGTDNQGIYIGWNKSTNTGEANFINQRGNGSGGFTFENTDGTTTTSLMTLSGSGDIYLPNIQSVANGTGGGMTFLAINTSTGKLTKYTLSSSRRYKDNISEILDIDWLYKLSPVNYSFKSDSTHHMDYGLIAEDVQKINPSLVVYNEKREVESISYISLIAPLIKAAQDQKNKIEILSSENQSLKSELQSLKSKMEQIEAALAKSGVK